MKKKLVPLIGSGVVAILIAVCCVLCLERVSVGNVGVVYSMSGLKDTTLSAGWHWLSPFESVKQFPVSQQQIVFSNSAEDYNAQSHPDWSIDAPANGGMVKMNLKAILNIGFYFSRMESAFKPSEFNSSTVVEAMKIHTVIPR